MSERCQAVDQRYRQCRKQATKDIWYVTFNCSSHVKATGAAVRLCPDHADRPKDKRK